MKKTKRLAKRKGQGLIEYLLLVTAVIVLLFTLFREGGSFSKVHQKVIDQQGKDMLNTAATIFKQ